MIKNTALQGLLSELGNFKIFEGLTPFQIQDLCESGEIVLNKHRQVLYKMGDTAESFGIVLSGAYKLSRLSPSGDETIVHFCTPGDVIGAFIMPQPNPTYPVFSHAMGPSRFLKIPREVYLTKWKQQPEIIFKIQTLLSSRFGSLQAQKALLKAPLSAKIAHFLLDILNKCEEGESTLPLPLTRKEIADSLGASVESVIRIMSDWSKKGIIETHDQHIHVLKMDKLIEEMSFSGP